MRCLSTILILALTIMFASKSYGESYACSHELSRFKRPGETETKIYTRKGNIFENNLATNIIYAAMLLSG